MIITLFRRIQNTLCISSIAALVLIGHTASRAESEEPDPLAAWSLRDVSPDISFTLEWSVVTLPAEEAQEEPIPLRPSEAGDAITPSAGKTGSDIIPGGQTRLPGTEAPVPATILPEMTPLLRPGPKEDFLDSVHGGMSRSVLATATWLDSFFGDERFDVENNQSRFKFRYIAFRETATPMEYRPEVDFRLVLPQLRKKTYLTISGDPNEDIEMSSSPAAPQGGPSLRPEDRNVTTALQYFFRSTDRSSYSIKTGAKLHNGKPLLFLGPRVRYFWPLDSWGLRFIEEVFWFTDTGWISSSRLDLERPMPRDLFFRTTLSGVWTEEKNGYPYSLAFVLLQPLDRNHALSYEWINSFNTRPTNELDEVLFVFRYRQRIWKDWLYLEIAPQERYPRDRGFRETPGIMVKLEMIVGDYKSFIF